VIRFFSLRTHFGLDNRPSSNFYKITFTRVKFFLMQLTMQLLESFMLIFQILFWFIIVLLPLVVIHEFGHLLIARLFGVKIPEFGVGIPLSKHRVSFKWKGINWSLYPWLIGGFVRIYGDHDPLDEAQCEYKTDPKKSLENYKINRKIELIQSQEISTFLDANGIDNDLYWKFIEINGIYILNSENFSSKFVKFIKQSNINTNEKNEFIKDFNAFTKQNLNLEEIVHSDSSILNDFLKQKFNSYTNQIETLTEWEFDNKIVNSLSNRKKDAFFQKNWLQQSLIVFGGIIFNLATAIVIFIFTFLSVGSLPTTLEIQNAKPVPIYQNQIDQISKGAVVEKLSQGLLITNIQKDSLGEALDIRKDDDLINIITYNNDEKTVYSTQNYGTFENFKTDIIKAFESDRAELEVIRNGQKQVLSVNDSWKNYSQTNTIGIGSGYKIVKKAGNLGQSVNMAFAETGFWIKTNLEGLGQIIVAVLPQTQDKTPLQNASGPIGVGFASAEFFNEFGLRGILYLMALISIALAVLNALPIPALDGGRFVILSLNAIFGKRNKRIEAIAISLTFILILGLAVLVAGQDIYKIYQTLK
jgi:regulator of sigma E protease